MEFNIASNGVLWFDKKSREVHILDRSNSNKDCYVEEDIKGLIDRPFYLSLKTLFEKWLESGKISDAIKLLSSIGVSVKNTTVYKSLSATSLIVIKDDNGHLFIVENENGIYIKKVRSFMKGIHKEAKDRWIQETWGKVEEFKGMLLPDMIRKLEGIANTISGIGQVTIDNTVAEIIDYFAEYERTRRKK